jgi:hypothetical protein
MTYKIIPLTKKGAAPKVTDQQMNKVQRILDLLMGPMIPEGRVITFNFTRKKDDADIEIKVLFNRMPWFSKEDRTAIGQIATALAGIETYDFKSALLAFSVKHRAVSAHDAIADRTELRAIAGAQDVNWPSISAAYDDVASRMRQKRSTVNA